MNRKVQIEKTDLIKLITDNAPITYLLFDSNFNLFYVNDYIVNVACRGKSNNIWDFFDSGGMQTLGEIVEKAIGTGKKQKAVHKQEMDNKNTKFIDEYAIPFSFDATGQPAFVLVMIVNHDKVLPKREQREQDWREILQALVSFLDAKDSYTAFHSKNVSELSLRLAKAFGMGDDEIFDIGMAAALHDIGKVHVPCNLINKKGRLNSAEFEEVKKHPEYACDVLNNFVGFDSISKSVKHHHERFDGLGYPEGLMGEEIPLGARIIAIADAYDTITTTRSYHKASSHEHALEEIRANAGTQFDPMLVDVFVNMPWDKDGNIDEDILFKKAEDELYIQDKYMNEAIKNFVVKKMLPYNLPKDEFLEVILNNAPVGYVLMNPEREIVFANKYFSEYIDVPNEKLLGKKCYNVKHEGIDCKECAIYRTLQTGKIETDRIKKEVARGFKCFDVCSVPIFDEQNKIKYVLEIDFDRTQEVVQQEQREKDFYCIINILTSFLQEEIEEDENIQEQIISLKDKVNVLLEDNRGNIVIKDLYI